MTSATDRTVDVVLFHLRPDGSTVPVDSTEPVSLSDPEPLSPARIGALISASVTLSSPTDLPDNLTAAVANLDVPTVFRSSPWLHEHRALVFTDGRCAIGKHVLLYEPRRGVHLSTERGAPSAPAPDPVPLIPNHSNAPAGVRPRSSRSERKHHTAVFDLCLEPWIPVTHLDGRSDVIGLRQLFRSAHLIRRIAAEAPTMTAALHRLAIAVLHRAFGPRSDRDWRELWEAEHFPTDPLQDYLVDTAEHFDLFHPERPFLQCPALSTLTPSSPGKLVPYRAMGNNVTLFDHTTATDRLRLPPADAARWLVTTLAFDPGGMKTPYERDKSSQAAPGNSFGVVLVEGANLKQTLLLNSVIYWPESEKPHGTSPADRPAWEDEDPPEPYPGARPALGWTDLLTWPSRRILLHRDDTGQVDGVALTPGVRLTASLPDIEKMAAFRRPTDARGRYKLEAPMLPVRLRPTRGVWRHAVELLLTNSWDEQRNRQRPGALDHIEKLAERGRIDPSTVYTLRIFGQQLDSKASVVEAWMEEEVPAPVALLRAHDENLGALVGRAITLADEVGAALRGLQRHYRAKFRAGATADLDIGYWPALTRPFAAFLIDLGRARAAGQSERAAAATWRRSVLHTADTVVGRWTASLAADSRRALALGEAHSIYQIRTAKLRQAYDAEVAIHVTGTDHPDV